jgi:hypothetical protein
MLDKSFGEMNFEENRSAFSDFVYRRGVIVLLVLAAGLRVALVVRGGQFFFPDEARYNVSRDAAALLAKGVWRAGIALPFEGGDHVGFKFLGILPALTERIIGTTSDLLPGVFWSLFSLGSVWLAGLVVGRMGGSPAARFWATMAAVTSATLFYYSRHLLPYDAAMGFVLAALFVALGRERNGEVGWVLLAGFLGGCSFLIYYGYWMLVGLTLLVAALYGQTEWRQRLTRLVLLGSGALGAILMAWAINRVLGSGQMIARAREFSGTITQGDYRGSLMTWEFLWRAEGLWLVATVFFGVIAGMVGWRARSGKIDAAAGIWAMGAVLGLWFSFTVTGDWLHKFVVYGRLIRQMTPWLCLAFGFGAAAWLARRGRVWSLGLAAVLALNAVWTLGATLALDFPGSFRRQWEAVLAAKQTEWAVANAYYRFVNVTHYVFEPEVLAGKPLETLAARAHPLAFDPYLYEGYSPAERARRRAVDHRMRFVKMAVPDSAKIGGADYGTVTMQVEFPRHRGGYIEPLLSVGPYQAGEVFFVQFLTDTLVRFGCEIMGQVVYFGDRLEIEAAKNYEISCFSACLLPLGEDWSPELAALRKPRIRDRVVMTLNGQEVINRSRPTPHVGRPQQVYAGVNTIGADSALTTFSGTINRVVRGGLPKPLETGLEKGSYGAVKLRLLLPATPTGRPEPLVVVGEAGLAVLGFIVALPEGRAQLGAEVWGMGAWRSDPVTLRPEESNEIIYEFGSLFPAEADDVAWGTISGAARSEHKRWLRIRVNGEVVLDRQVQTPEMGQTTVEVGRNLVGGSYVGEAYSGTILKVERVGWPVRTANQ